MRSKEGKLSGPKFSNVKLFQAGAYPCMYIYIYISAVWTRKQQYFQISTVLGAGILKSLPLWTKNREGGGFFFLFPIGLLGAYCNDTRELSHCSQLVSQSFLSLRFCFWTLVFERLSSWWISLEFRVWRVRMNMFEGGSCLWIASLIGSWTSNKKKERLVLWKLDLWHLRTHEKK